MNIHILAIDTGLEAHAIRLAAEQWGASVSVTWVGNAQQIVDFFRAGACHDVILISGHGDEHGLLLPQLAPDIQHLYLYTTHLTPASFAAFLPPTRAIIVNLACVGGAAAFAQVFLERGARAYIGALDYPDGGACLMYALELLYTHLHNGARIEVAHEQAARHEDDRKQFRLYQNTQDSS